MTLIVRSDMSRRTIGLASLAVFLVPATAAATLGPPEGRVDPPPALEEAPSPESQAESTPVTQPPPPPAPIVQHPDDPVPAEAPPPAPAAPPTPTVTAKQEPQYERLIRYILSGHRENYFISGVSSSQHQVKFQYSVKFDLWPNASRHSAYFGFTQKSLWGLWDFDNSSPFIESNYAPEFFYGYSARRGDIVPAANQLTWFLDYARAGFEHESNGMDGANSRGWNRFQGAARGGVYLGWNHYVTLALKAWFPPWGDSENPDITDYLGYGIATLEYGYDPAFKHWYGGGNVTVSYQQGASLDWSRHGLQVTGQWRPGYGGKFVEWIKLTPYFYAQLWSGYGETLLRYNVDDTSFRVGLSFEDRVTWVVKKPSSTPAN